jgi:hypothetical protein
MPTQNIGSDGSVVDRLWQASFDDLVGVDQ